MGDTAVMQAMGDLRKAELIVKHHLFCLFYLVDDDELLNGDAFHLREDACQVVVVVAQLLADVDRVIHLRLFFRGMDDVCDQLLYPVYQFAFAVIEQLQAGFA